MQKPKSKYVKKKFKNTHWKHREYIYRLLNMEYYAIYGPCSWTGSMAYHSLKQNWKDFGAICRELNPKRYNIEVAKRNKDERDTKRAEEWDKREMKKEKKAWIQSGGLM